MARPSRWPDIVIAAGEEFRTHGFENATLDDIAARVGILKGSIYNYVSCKEDLLLAVVEEPARSLLAELENLRADTDHTVTERLRQLFRSQIKVFREHYPAAFVYLHNIGRVEISERFREFHEMDIHYMNAVEELMAEGAASGEFALPVEPRIAARSVVGMLNWMQHWFTPSTAEADQELADSLFALALGGLSAGGSLAKIIAPRGAG